MSYPPPYPPYQPQPPYQPPRVTSGAKPKRALLFALPIMALLVAGGAFLAAGGGSGADKDPQIGDCLSSAEESFFGGVYTVGCGSAEAKYEVVAKRSWSNVTVYKHDVCGDRDGATIQQGDGKYQDGWEICVVPVD